MIRFIPTREFLGLKLKESSVAYNVIQMRENVNDRQVGIVLDTEKDINYIPRDDEKFMGFSSLNLEELKQIVAFLETKK